jgi:hypothetical protein
MVERSGKDKHFMEVMYSFLKGIYAATTLQIYPRPECLVTLFIKGKLGSAFRNGQI